MGLIEKIEEIQQRPEGERHKIFIITLTISMTVVLGIWFSALKYNLGSWGQAEQEATPSPLALIRESVNNISEKIKTELQGIPDQLQLQYQRSQ
jgi:hypothetical protein